MRKYLRTLLLLLVFAAIFPFVYPWKDGKPLLSWSDIKLPPLQLPELPEIRLPGSRETAREPHQPVKLYRWQDATGNIQFSNTPPAEGVTYEQVEVNPDANLIQALPAGNTSEEETTAKQEVSEAGSTLPSPLTVSPGEALQLMEDARHIREMSEQRLRQHEALTQ